MPVISRFYGLIVKMYFGQSEHNPPHVHVIYGEKVGVINIETLEIMEGDLPKRAFALVKEWMSVNQDNLMRIWKTQEFKKLPPLE